MTNTTEWKHRELCGRNSSTRNLRKPVGRRLLLLLAAPLVLGVAGCGTNRKSINTTETRNVCQPWKAIDYDGKKDTKPTVQQIQEHNETGANIGCWPR